jgi:predicted DNA-binding transcriptional regulator YafY
MSEHVLSPLGAEPFRGGDTVAVFPQLERILWLDGKLKEGRYPNAFHLSEHFEVSHKTAQREIDLLRDRFQAPVEYNQSRNGYRYID